MMAASHPSEIELLEEVEGELEPGRSAELRTHLESCDTCSVAMAELVQARAVLHSSPLLELPPARVREMVASFPKREREQRGRLRRLSALPAVAAIAALAAAIIAVTVTAPWESDSGADRTAAGEAAAPVDAREGPALELEAQADAGAAEAAPEEPPAPAEPSPPSAEPAPAPPEQPAPAEEPAPTLESFSAPTPVASLEGTPEEIAARLEELGFSAEVLDARTVQVSGATAEAVRDALASLPPGGVDVIVLEEMP
jgi:hypothetical protein